MLTDKVYEDMRKKILNLTLKPGSKLNFPALRSYYGVSNSPVRDALKRLESEGLVCIKAQSGTSVARIDLQMVEDEKFRRLYLELGAIEQLFENGISEELIKNAEQLIEKQREAFGIRDKEAFLSLDDRMHRLFFEENNHEKVFDSMISASGNYTRVRMVSYLFDDVFKCSLDQHVEILKAVRDKDLAGTLYLEKAHISRIENETFAYRNSYPLYFI